MNLSWMLSKEEYEKHKRERDRMHGEMERIRDESSKKNYYCFGNTGSPVEFTDFLKEELEDLSCMYANSLESLDKMHESSLENLVYDMKVFVDIHHKRSKLQDKIYSLESKIKKQKPEGVENDI